jgi:hypothetical protein
MKQFGILAVLVAWAFSARADETDRLFNVCCWADAVVVAKVTGAKAVGATMMEPPTYFGDLTISEGQALRGTPPLTGKLRFNARDKTPFEKANGERRILILTQPSDDQDGWSVKELLAATDANLALARAAAGVPFGWYREVGKLVSPWETWDKSTKVDAKLKCTRSGRPALLAGMGLKLTVEQVPAEKVIKWKNDYGDGRFKVTVTNTGAKPVEVPALLAVGGDPAKISWADSLVFVDEHVRVLPGGGVAGLKPVTLAAGQSVSGVVDTLLLDGVQWPRGGSRIYFQFGLGELAARNFFYYFSDLHDKIREQRQRK